MGNDKVSDPLGKRRSAARDHMVTEQRLLERSPFGVRESDVDPLLTRIGCRGPSTLRHRFSDITISLNRVGSKFAIRSSVTSRFRGRLNAFLSGDVVIPPFVLER